jgi:hypothetical protein
MVDIGSVTDAELAINKISRHRDHLLLYVHGDTYTLPTNWEKMDPAEVLKHSDLHDKIHAAIMNDGRNPVQIEVLEQNRQRYEAVRPKAVAEEDLWTGIGVPTPQQGEKLYTPPWS